MSRDRVDEIQKRRIKRNAKLYDEAEAEIDRAVAENRPVDLSRAFPEPPAPMFQDKPDEYVKEHQLRMLHRLMLRGLSTEMIAKHMGLSAREVRALRDEVKARLRLESMNFDVHGYLARTRAFYQEIATSALRDADNTKQIREKNDSRRVALAALGEEFKLLASSGIIQSALLRVRDLEGEINDPYAEGAKRVITLIKAVAEGDYSVLDEEESSPLDDDIRLLP